MSIANYTIELSEPTYKKLLTAAHEQRVEVEALIRRLLERETVEPKPQPEPETDYSNHPFADLLAIAEDLGVDDLAENHDHYIYGVPKRSESEEA